MSSITIGNLPRMTRDVLSTLVLSSTTASANKLAIIDVRDSGTSPTPPSPGPARPYLS
jgi:hypothetical protein